ncbi:hypothetical protein SAMN03159444_04382 [Pseudomonas sp. NFACC02]|nr:hypothetical protein SAMN03159444_04382 [Pseudomonas sp. NFACC02]
MRLVLVLAHGSEGDRSRMIMASMVVVVMPMGRVIMASMVMTCVRLIKRALRRMFVYRVTHG